MNGVEQKNHRTAVLQLRADMVVFAERVEAKFQAMRTELDAEIAAARRVTELAERAARLHADDGDRALRGDLARLEAVCYRRLWGRLKVLLLGDGVPSR